MSHSKNDISLSFESSKEVLANGDISITPYELNQFFCNVNYDFLQASYYQPPWRICDAISHSWNIPSEKIYISQGVDSLLHDIILTLSTGLNPILLFWPAYHFAEHAANILSRSIFRVNLLDNGEYPISLPSEAVESRPDIAVIINPTNPGGISIPIEIIKLYMDQLPNTYFIVDESYIDFYREDSVLELFFESDKIIILRGLSKGYALPGLRIGAAMCNDKDLIYKLYSNRVHFFSPQSVEWSIKVLTHSKYFIRTIKKNISIKKILIDYFKEVKKLSILDTRTNFLLIRYSEDISKEFLKEICLEYGVKFWWFDESTLFRSYFNSPVAHPSLDRTFRVSPVMDSDLKQIENLTLHLAKTL